MFIRKLLPLFVLTTVMVASWGWNIVGANSKESSKAVLSQASKATAEANGSTLTYEVGPDGHIVAVVRSAIPDDLSFARFDKWRLEYATASKAQKIMLEAVGVQLAKGRREAMHELIRRDPKHAIELAVTSQNRLGLPATVVAELEVVLQGRGSYSLLQYDNAVPVKKADEMTARTKPRAPVQSSLHRSLILNGHVYTAFIYGKRNSLLSKNDLPVYGIAIDNDIAIDESPIHVLAAGETLPTGSAPSKYGTKCPVCGKDAAHGIRGLVGSTVYYFDSVQDLQ